MGEKPNAAARASADQPRVSVIVPTFNSVRTVGDAIASVRAQTLRSWELICVDDGSTDGTPDLLERAAAEDGRIRVLRQENAGPGVARNRALDQARGEFVYCLDADDLIDPGFLEAAASALADAQADLCLSAYRVLNDQLGMEFPEPWGLRHADAFPCFPAGGAFCGEADPDRFFEVVQNVPWNKVVRRSLLVERGIRFQEIRLTEDLMYSLPAALAARRIVRLGTPFVVHRELSGTNAMADKGRHPLDVLAAFAALRAHLEGEGLYERYRTGYRRWLADALYYNLPTYRRIEDFAAAYAELTRDGLAAYDLAEARPEEFDDLRHARMVAALQSGGREAFLLACLNIVADEVQDQRSGFQERQTSTKWLLDRLRDRLRRTFKRS